MDKLKELADLLYDQKIKEGWKNVSMEECLNRAVDYYRIEKLVKESDSLANERWAKMREDACRVREQVAINFMLETYCDVEVTEELQKEAYEDFKKRYVG